VNIDKTARTVQHPLTVSDETDIDRENFKRKVRQPNLLSHYFKRVHVYWLADIAFSSVTHICRDVNYGRRFDTRRHVAFRT